MVKLRLKRMGKKKHPYYRIVAADVRSPRDGRFIEEIGFYDPSEEPSVVRIRRCEEVACKRRRSDRDGREASEADRSPLTPAIKEVQRERAGRDHRESAGGPSF